MTLKIQVWGRDGHKNVIGLNQLMEFQLLYKYSQESKMSTILGNL
jgi:hypothetical protein